MTSVDLKQFENRQDDFGPRYDMPEHEVNALTFQLLYEQKDTLPQGHQFVCMRIAGSSRFANISRKIEGEVFTLDLQDNTDEMIDDFGPYEDQSYFFTVFDTVNLRPVGALRVIQNGSNGFSATNGIAEPPHCIDINQFFEDYKETPETTWDVGTIAVLPQYRRGVNATPEQKLSDAIVSGLLYRALYAGARENGITSFISLIDPLALSKLRGLGFPFTDIYDCPPKEFSNNTVFQPTHAYVDTFYDKIMEHMQTKIDAATSESEKIKAQNRTELVLELLTGNALDGMMAFRHNNIAINSVT